MRVLNMIVCILLMSIGVSKAEILKNPNGWWCGPIDDWNTAQIELGNNLIANNFLLKESGAYSSGQIQSINVSFSVSNRSDSSLNFRTQIAGLAKNGNLTFAIEASPSLRMFESGITENSVNTIEGSNYSNSKLLSKTASICMEFVFWENAF